VSPDNVQGTWIKKSRIPALPLTGLARKILRKAGLLESQFASETRETPRRG
jgi:hypothetical protein